MTRQRHPMYLTVKTGVTRRARSWPSRSLAHADGGAYNSTAPLMITLSCFFIMIPYKIENLLYEGYHVYTNKPVGGAMRGHGIPQARFAIERQIDLIARRIGVDSGRDARAERHQGRRAPPGRLRHQHLRVRRKS